MSACISCVEAIDVDWQDIVWYAFLYVAGYFAHHEPARISFTFRAPTALVLLCGRPLGKNKLEFSPMVAQLAGLGCLAAALMNHFGLLARRTTIFIDIGLQFTWILCTLIPLFLVHKGRR